MIRSVIRFVEHTIRHVPEGGHSFETICVVPVCNASSGAQGDQDVAQLWALKHTGMNPTHDLFRRVATDHARVTPA